MNKTKGLLKNSLYINPQKIEKNDININIPVKFLTNYNFLPAKNIKKNENAVNKEPWPISPNITPKKNGKEIIVKTAGLISPYFGIE